MKYFITQNYSVAFIPKAGCSTFSRAIIKAFQPEEESIIQNSAFPEGRGPDNLHWQWMVKAEDDPSKPVLAFIRHPLQRFLSAMAEFGRTDIDETLHVMRNNLEVKSRVNTKMYILANNPHFRPQILWMTPTTKLYRFPDHLNEGAQELGLSLPLPKINQAKRPKPTPTAEQEAEILNYYAEDLALYNAIVSAGVITGIVPSNPESALVRPSSEM